MLRAEIRAVHARTEREILTCGPGIRLYDSRDIEIYVLIILSMVSSNNYAQGVQQMYVC